MNESNRDHLSDPRRIALVATGIALAGVAFYLGQTWAGGHIGFPLDDAWIHQTYARNLVEAGEWAFVPGQPSAGSTAPLWTLLLALGYALGVPFRAWVYGLGGLCLGCTAWVAGRLAQRLFPRQPLAPLLTAAVCALEWHLIWAAASGMETVLFAWLALVLWERVVSAAPRNAFLTGLLGGALVLTRPEGITAVGLAALAAFVVSTRSDGWRRGLLQSALLAAGATLVLTPYLALNLRLSGTVWPNTLYAKQAEYAVLRLQPLWLRLWRVSITPLVGGQILLLPGLVWGVWQLARRGERAAWDRRIVALLPLLWVAGTVTTYALQLPVTYQYGRYLMPVIPIVLVYGIGGTVALTEWARRSRAARVGMHTLGGAVVILLGAFWLRGAQAYAADVAFIENEMVTVARWLDAHTSPDALIAAHDIGAIGYFARRPLLDLAGLISPEVIPFIRDEAALLEWIEQRNADYLVTFPSWYPTLIADPRLEQVFETGAQATLDMGHDNMAVYALHFDRNRQASALSASVR